MSNILILFFFQNDGYMRVPAGQLDCRSPGDLLTYLSQEHEATMIGALPCMAKLRSSTS